MATAERIYVPESLTIEPKTGRMFHDPTAPDREALRCELIALYRQYVADAADAGALQDEYAERMEQARSLHRSVQHKIEVVRDLLEAEFPDWNRTYCDA